MLWFDHSCFEQGATSHKKSGGSIIQYTRVFCLERFVECFEIVMIKKLKESQIIFCLLRFLSLSFVPGFEQFTCKPVLDPIPSSVATPVVLKLHLPKFASSLFCLDSQRMQQYIGSCFFCKFSNSLLEKASSFHA